MSVASDATSDAGEERERNSLDISMRALRNLKDALENDSVRAHRRGVAKLCLLKTRLEASDDLAKDVAQVLASAGAMVGRAVTFAVNEDDRSDLSITLSLLFGLVDSGNSVEVDTSVRLHLDPGLRLSNIELVHSS